MPCSVCAPDAALLLASHSTPWARVRIDISTPDLGRPRNTPSDPVKRFPELRAAFA
jgi:hypothetical protein